MKNSILFFFCLFCSHLFAQNFDKAWASLEKRIRAGEDIGANEQSAFLAKYEKDLASHPIEKSILYNGIANKFTLAQNYNDAIAFHEKSIELAKIAGDTIYAALYYYDLASLYNHIGYYTNAEPYFIKSLPTLSLYYGQSSLKYTMCFKELTDMYIEMGRYNEAKVYNDALLYYFKTLNGEQDRMYLICLTNDARISQGYGEYEKAIDLFEKINRIHAIAVPMDTSDYISSLNNTAEAYRQLNEYSQAMSLFEKALSYSFAYSKNEELSLATIYNNYGLCLKATGNYQQAEEAFDKCTAIYNKLKLDFIPDYTNSLSNKADMYRILGRNKQAYDLLAEVKDIREKSLGTKHVNYANTITNMALVRIADYFNSGNHEYLSDAENYLTTAMSIYKEALGEYHPYYANCLNNLSMLAIYFKKWKEAENYKSKALEITKQLYGDTTVQYANFLGGTVSLYEASGNYQKAIENVETAARILQNKLGKKHIDYIDGQFNLAYLKWKIKDYPSAQKLFIQTVNSYKEQFNNFFESMSENEQMSFYLTIGDRFESVNSFMIEYTRQFPNKNHSELLSTCFNNQLFIKSILLSQSIATRRTILNSKDTSLINMYNQWLSVKQTIAGIYRDSEYEKNYWNEAELQVQSDKLEQKIKSKINLFKKNTDCSYKAIQTKLADNEAALAILREDIKTSDTTSQTEYVALLIKKTSPNPELIRFNDANYFETLFIEQYQEAIDNKKEDQVSYQRFWEPIALKTTGINKLYITSDGIYNQINLYTLYNPAKRKYLLDLTEISIVPNLSYLNETFTPSENKTAVLFGNPDYEYDFNKKKTIMTSGTVAKNRFGFSELPPLPGTQTEVENISASLKQNDWKVSTYTKTEATESALKTVESPKVLHIATHGFFLKNIKEYEDKSILGFETNNLKSNPLLRSGIMMAGASVVARDTNNIYKEQDGIFTAYEASLLNLTNTDLVVLSACETGLGVDLNSQGVFGLQRAFYIAGAKNLIMSLWAVDDDATQLLMSEFYREWSKQPTQQTISAAFKKAQAEVRKRYPHPYYWGAFVLLGK